MMSLNIQRSSTCQAQLARKPDILARADGRFN